MPTIGSNALLGWVVVGMAVMARLERRSFADYGLPLRGGFAARFGEGMLWGFAAATIVSRSWILVLTPTLSQ